MQDRDETQFEDGFTPVEDGFTPVDDEAGDESMPRRAAFGIAGGLAALALAAGSQSASAHPGQDGLVTRIRQVTDSVVVPGRGTSRDRRLTLRCPRPRSNERVYVVGGGYAINRAEPQFVVTISAPGSNSSWIVEGHNHSANDVSMGGNAICVYVRR